jgi:hypothetical protein
MATTAAPRTVNAGHRPTCSNHSRRCILAIFPIVLRIRLSMPLPLPCPIARCGDLLAGHVVRKPILR